MSEIVLVYTLLGDRAAAEKMATLLVERRLAACANLLADGISIYPWEGKIERSSEVPILFKTAPARRDALIAAIEEAHDYTLPAILSWPVQTTQAYAEWVAGETGV